MERTINEEDSHPAVLLPALSVPPADSPFAGKVRVLERTVGVREPSKFGVLEGVGDLHGVKVQTAEVIAEGNVNIIFKKRLKKQKISDVVILKRVRSLPDSDRKPEAGRALAAHPSRTPMVS